MYYVKVPGFDFEYSMGVWKPGGVYEVHPVRGFQVGMFAVRLMPDDVKVGTNASRYGYTKKLWVVDHPPSYTGVVNVGTRDAAMVIIDDLSRFSAEEPDSSNWHKLCKQLGPELVDWCKAIVGGYPLIGGFRAWRDKQDPYLLLAALYLGIPYEEVKERYKAKDEVVRYWRMHMKKASFAGSMGLGGKF